MADRLSGGTPRKTETGAAASRQKHERLTGADDAPQNVLAEGEVLRRKNQDHRSVLEPAQLLSLTVRRAAGDHMGPAISKAEGDIEKVQFDACDEYRG